MTNTPIYEETLDDTMRINMLEEEFSHVPMGEYTGITAALEFAYESELAFNKIKQFLMVEDVKYFKKNNRILFEDYYIENQAEQKSIFKKAIDMVLKWLEHLKEIFTRIFKAVQDRMDKYVLLNDAFVKKFDNKLKGITPSDTVEFEGFDFSNVKQPTIYPPDYIRDFTASDDKNLPSDFESKMCSMIMQRTMQLDSSHEIVKEVNDGQPNIVNLTNKINAFYKHDKQNRHYNIKEQLDIIKSFKKDKIASRKVYANNMSALKTMETLLQRMVKSTADDKKIAKENLDIGINLVKFHSNINKICFDCYTDALITRCSQARAICRVAIIEQNKTADSQVHHNSANLSTKSLQDIFDGAF